MSEQAKNTTAEPKVGEHSPAEHEDAIKRSIALRIQAMLAAARKEIEQLRRMLADCAGKDDTVGATICLKALAEIEMAATDRAMNYTRDQLINNMLAHAAQHQAEPGA